MSLEQHEAKMESLVHFCNPAHGISLLGALNEQRLSGQLCDVILLVGDQQFQAHKSILASCSEYFQSVFSQKDSENRCIIQLNFCEPDAFEIVLNYIYSSSLFVEKCSLAAIQELGYSLGIPFLTNIMSTRPQASYCVSRKRILLSEEDDGAYQKRSVIVHQGDQPGMDVFSRRSHQGRPIKQTTAMIPEKPSLAHDFSDQSHTGHVKQNEKESDSTSVSRNSNKNPVDGDCRSILSSPTSILRRRTEYRPPSMRPQLTSSVSFSESVQHSSLQSEQPEDSIEDQMEFAHDRKPAGEHQGPRNQTVDRSGPLIKSLLRRSLSMDSPVPVFSPALELKDSQNREQTVVKLTTPTGRSPSPESEDGVLNDMPLILRSRQRNTYETEGTQTTPLRIKAEPSSPLADPSEIVRITVGDNLPVNFKDFQANYDEGPRGYFTPSIKRKSKMDGSYMPFKRTKPVNEHHISHQDRTFSEVPYTSNNEKSNEEPGELRPNKMFKCWNCLKVFRSNAGLYRHVNMYHNPEKPYACDICHKRFHTNFKVWTHCQTQHGVVQNPAPSSSSYSVLDEKFQRKLIDIVREREIKKALIMKLRRTKQGLQSQPFGRKSRRTKSYGCPFCGKMFHFQSQLKLHMKGHSAETASLDPDAERDLQYKQQQLAHLKENQDKDVFSCRLCNEKLPSLTELEDHERACRYSTVCPYCGLRFSNTLVKKDHEAHCKYKKLTCLECMRTFKSSFSIWRHQVEVHNQNMMTLKEQLTLGLQESNHDESSDGLGVPPPSQESMNDTREEVVYSDSSVPPMFDSEDSSSYVPEDLSQGELQVKEEPQEEAVSAKDNISATCIGSEEPGVWPCEKCGKLFSSHKDLERHQELLCHIKPFICHICHKAFRTNFRLWSHYQSHMSASEEPGMRENDGLPSSPSPSPPLTIAISEPPTSQVSPLKVIQSGVADSEEEPRGSMSPSTKLKKPDQDKAADDEPREHSHAKSDSTDKAITPQESDTLFYHAPTLSALTFKRQYMCKFCHRTFKTAFSLWSHEQSHT
ncbi:zinc finger and BTB domain-containing protein 21-like isoform X1 [Myxocyprinus asiaticus]|uniref:zinc finger and BTB domain-containing protein 21-like isoform X1 n=3 Tax=Myxocyprinus asiaticus TaxID=70543 RepID=UPI002221EE57|nr:zinc finger and BTB domain-containing protein 21-like isoform X1 [Myxocyprinus asiaticus]